MLITILLIVVLSIGCGYPIYRMLAFEHLTAAQSSLIEVGIDVFDEPFVYINPYEMKRL